LALIERLETDGAKGLLEEKAAVGARAGAEAGVAGKGGQRTCEAQQHEDTELHKLQRIVVECGESRPPDVRNNKREETEQQEHVSFIEWTLGDRLGQIGRERCEVLLGEGVAAIVLERVGGHGLPGTAGGIVRFCDAPIVDRILLWAIVHKTSVL
jgi:hypothetical protein